MNQREKCKFALSLTESCRRQYLDLFTSDIYNAVLGTCALHIGRCCGAHHTPDAASAGSLLVCVRVHKTLFDIGSFLTTATSQMPKLYPLFRTYS